MNQVNKFFLRQAIYQVEVGGSEMLLKLDYAGNSYEVEGQETRLVREIAREMLGKKHGVNFAYKFAHLGERGDDKMEVG